MMIRDIQERCSHLSSVQEVERERCSSSSRPVLREAYRVVALRVRTGRGVGGHSEAAGAPRPLFLSDKRPVLAAAPNPRVWRPDDDDALLALQLRFLLLDAPGSCTRAVVAEMQRHRLFQMPQEGSLISCACVRVHYSRWRARMG